MSRRASAAAQTRQRIVDATLALHGEQGIAATSYDDIAARAGVGVGTVYRHFPSLDELIPACGAVTMERIAPPDPAAASSRFERLDTPAARVHRLVAEAFALYERGAPQLRAIRREPDVHPDVAAAGHAIEASLDALIAAALEPASVTPADRAVIRAMIDLGTWQAMRDQGLGPAEAVTAVSGMLATRLRGAAG